MMNHHRQDRVEQFDLRQVLPKICRHVCPLKKKTKKNYKKLIVKKTI